MHYYTVEQIGPKRSLRPNGTLICQDVPIARTGMQIYGPEETPVAPGTADLVRIEREPDEVFHPDCLASLQGAPIVNEHPMDEDGGRADVTPDNYRDLAIGHVLNPRRGEGIDNDVCIADLLIWDKNAIQLIDAGKRELSVGYDADYEELEPGHGRQHNIRANHVALVDRGRCGPRCAIGDSETLVALSQCEVDHRTHTEDGAMPALATKTTWRARVRAAFKARDEEALNEAMDGIEEIGATPEATPEPNGKGESHVHVHLPNGGGDPPPAESDQVPPVPATGAPPPAVPDNGDPPPAAAAGDPAEMLKQAITAIHQEMDEMWDAIGTTAGGAPMADAYAHRDARRGADEFPPKEEEEKTDDELPGAPGNTAGNRSILSGFEMEAPAGTKMGDLKRARDSALFEDSFSETMSMAEIILPGVRLPTFDKAAKPKTTYDAICGFRGRVLDAAFTMPETREIIDDLMGGRFVSTKNMTCDSVRQLFRAVAKQRGGVNNTAARPVELAFGGGVVSSAMQSPADLQAALDKHYAAQRPTSR